MNKKIFLIITLIIIAIIGFYFWNKNQNQKNNYNKNQPIFYFAYGSNMNTAQMKERCGIGFKEISPAKLDNYELGFDKRGYANIRPRQGELVWGFVWEINTSCVNALDGYEGYPDVYNRKDVLVISDRHSLDAFVYIESEEEFGGTPQIDYLNNKIIPGAKENGLPQEWIKKLEQYR